MQWPRNPVVLYKRNKVNFHHFDADDLRKLKT